MFVRSTIVGVFGLATLSSASVAAPRDPSGIWFTEDGRARIAVEKCGASHDNVCGYVVWLKSPLADDGQPRRDVKNPDPQKKTRPTLGHQLIMGLKPNADDRYEGKIYNSEDGNQYNVTVWAEGAGQLKVKGCLIAFLCSTQTWTKVTDVASGQLTGAAGAPNGPVPEPEWASKPSAPKPAPAKPAPKS